MPQLDRLAFYSQIFWLFFGLIFFYFFFLQICVVRLKFNLGLKRFLLQPNRHSQFRDLAQSFGVGGPLLFFRSGSVTAETLPTYALVLTFRRSYETFAFQHLRRSADAELKNLSALSRDVLYFCDRSFLYFGYFFRFIRYYIYEVLFTLFYGFFNFFYRIRRIFFFFRILRKDILYR